MKPYNQLIQNVEVAINELCDFALDKKAKATNPAAHFDYDKIINECRWMTYHKCEIIKLIETLKKGDSI